MTNTQTPTTVETINTALPLTLTLLGINTLRALAEVLASATSFGLTADLCNEETFRFIFAGPDADLDAFLVVNGLNRNYGPLEAFAAFINLIPDADFDRIWDTSDEPCEFGHVVGVKGCPACDPASDHDNGW